MTKSKHAPAVTVLADQSKAVSLMNPVYCRTQIKELCESRGGRPGLSVITSLVVSVDAKQY